MCSSDLRFPTQDAWSLIQDRLLGHLGSDFFRPMGEVLKELQQEADRFWRDNRRGKHQDKALADRLAELRELRREAAERDRRLRQAHQRLAALAEERERLRAREIELEAGRRKASRLIPVRRTLDRIAALRDEAGDLSPWKSVPDDPLAALASLEQQAAACEGELAELEEAAERCRREQAAFTAADRALLEREGDIAECAARLSRIEHAHDRDAELAHQEAGIRERLAGVASRLLAVPWSDELAEPAARISADDVRAHLQAYREADSRYEQARARLAALRAQAATPVEGASLRWAAIMMVVGVALAAIGGAGVIDVLLWGGLLLALAGVLQGWSAWQNRQRRRRERVQRRRMENEAAAAEAEAAQARDGALRAVEGAFAALPVKPSRLETPDDTLLVDVLEIQGALQALQAVRDERARLHETVAAIRRDVQAMVEEIAAAVATEAPPGPAAPLETVPAAGAAGVAADAAPVPEEPTRRGAPAEETPAAPSWDEVVREIRALPARLADARDRLHRARAAEGELAGIMRERERLVARRNGLLQERDALLAALAPLAPEGDVEEQAAVLRRRRDAAREAHALEDALRRQHPDLDAIRAEIAAAEARGDGWELSDAHVVALEKELEDVRAALDALREEGAALSAQIAHLEEQPTLDFVEGEMAALEEERRTVRRERDRLALLIRVLQEADRRFREEHQPDVLRRAGDYIRTITGGRYSRLFVEQGPSGLQAHLREADHPFTRELGAPLSRGTLDQVYVALRLAIVDHLDANQEPLPLFLDEVFVNWDGARRRNALALLEQVSARRQVFFFTCHQWLAEEVLSALPGHQLVLPDPGSP